MARFVAHIQGKSNLPLVLFTASVVNIATGLVYVWGIFLIPLEQEIGGSRSELGFVSSVSLVCFTVGMAVHDKLLNRLGRIRFAFLAFGLAAGGHLLYAAVPTYVTLLAGYGLSFGLGAGFGYGLALSLASAAPQQSRALALGIVMAAFAGSGILLPLLLGPFIASSPASTSFAAIGVAVAFVGLLVMVLLNMLSSSAPAVARSDEAGTARVSGAALLKLGAVFFLLCFVGLMVVSHGVAIVKSSGAPDRTAQLTATIFTIGYLFGSLFGGRLVELLGGWITIIAVSFASGLGVWLLTGGGEAAWFVGAAGVGVSLGSLASVVPMIIGQLYGASQIGPVYSKLMIGYGLAGLLAPWLAGALFTHFGNYAAAVHLGVVLSILTAIIGVAMKNARAIQT